MKTLFMACTYVPKKKPFQTQNKCKYHLIQYCIQVIEINSLKLTNKQTIENEVLNKIANA